MSNPAPICATERIQEIDIIRGFALFGVLWLNLVAQSHTLAPAGAFVDLATAPLDAVVAPIAGLFVSWKAMTLFSLLFGYGFAMIMSRLESRNVNANAIFLRRTAILLSFGIIHIWFIWIGDILHVYALMGFLLFLTRKWPDRRLLIVGLFLAVFSQALLEAILQHFYDEPFPWWSIFDEGAKRRFELFQGSSYIAYVGELWRASWEEMWGVPDYISYCTVTLGRFMLGAWIFRMGWMQRTNELRPLFRRWAVILFCAGILLSLANMRLYEINEALAFAVDPLPHLVLALGYGAIVVAACKNESIRLALGGVAAVGRTALTNYLLQSVMYVFVLYGFGFGLLDALGATLCLALALVTFAMQVLFSNWWVRRFRFGPMEWIWRSLTYGQRQPMRLITSDVF
jgi:uncharacterized protein